MFSVITKDFQDKNTNIPDLEFETTNLESCDDSEKELQVAFQKGFLKDLVIETNEKKIKKVNYELGLEEALKTFKTNINWKESLDIVIEPMKFSSFFKNEKQNGKYNNKEDEFEVENRCYRQAQAAVCEGLSILRKEGIPTKRPQDYFAEMVKSDVHMKKIKEKILNIELIKEKSEQVKKQREARNFKKLMDKEKKNNKKKEKMEYKESLKKVKRKIKLKKHISSKSFDETEKEIVKKKELKKTQNKFKFSVKSNRKRQTKNEKFGFGGQKKRLKMNSKKSLDDSFGNSKKNTRRNKKSIGKIIKKF